MQYIYLMLLIILFQLVVIVFLLKRQQKPPLTQEEVNKIYWYGVQQASQYYTQYYSSQINTLQETIEELKNQYKQMITEKEKEVRDVKKHYDKLVNEIEKRHVEEIRRLKEEFENEKRKVEKQAMERSRKSQQNSIKGRVAEQLAPLCNIEKLGIDPSEMRFIGTPVDYVVFKGHKKGKIEEIIFLEVKTGNSKLTPKERQVKKVIEEKRVKWKEFRINLKTRKPNTEK